MSQGFQKTKDTYQILINSSMLILQIRYCNFLKFLCFLIIQMNLEHLQRKNEWGYNLSCKTSAFLKTLPAQK